MRKLSENPHDVQALNEMYQAQNGVSFFALKKLQKKNMKIFSVQIFTKMFCKYHFRCEIGQKVSKCQVSLLVQLELKYSHQLNLVPVTKPGLAR